MGKSISITYDSVERLTYEADGHYHLHIPTFYEFGSFSNHKVDFIFDTGAYITVITQKEAALLGISDAYTVSSNVPLSGFAGGCLVDYKRIPGFIIGGMRFEGVVVAVPLVDTESNILGLNVIDAFRFYIDTALDKVYFSYNSQNAIPEALRSDKVYA